jgi:hypothetical protein
LDDAEEQALGTNAMEADSDGDGLDDAAEVAAGTNPQNPDTDGDGLTDGADPDPIEEADVEPPTLAITYSPENPTRVDLVTFTATASDNRELSRVQIILDGAVVKECPGSPCTYDAGPYPNSSEVSYRAAAWDGVNNQAVTALDVLNLASAVIFDFVEEAPDASWRSGSGSLQWPGTESDDEGFAKWVEDAGLENGNEVDRALETHPQWVDNGYIQGTYTEPFHQGYRIEESDVFYAVVGLRNGAGAGDVTFRVMLRTQGMGNHWIAEVPDAYDGKMKVIQVPLEPWAGQRADFVLRVDAGSSSQQDWAMWSTARVYRGNPPLVLLAPIQLLPIEINP